MSNFGRKMDFLIVGGEIMKKLLFVIILILVLALVGCGPEGTPSDNTDVAEDDPQELAIVNDLFTEYLESFQEGGEGYPNAYLDQKGKILDYTIDMIDIMDNEFEERQRETELFADATEDAIFATVSFTVTPEQIDEKSMTWATDSNAIEGDIIHCNRVLFVDKMDGEYQIVVIGTGW